MFFIFVIHQHFQFQDVKDITQSSKAIQNGVAPNARVYHA